MFNLFTKVNFIFKKEKSKFGNCKIKIHANKLELPTKPKFPKPVYFPRKIILFSEYVDTIHHLEKLFKSEFKNEVLVCDGKVSKDLARHLNSDFNAQYNRG